MTAEPTVLSAIAEGVAEITLNRPDTLNAFNVEMHVALRAAVAAASADESVRAILLTGAGRAFCAGQDLGDRNTGRDAPPPDLGDTLETHYNPLVTLIATSPKPVVCAVNGAAAGAGANVALACDIVVASKTAKFIQAFCRLGLIPDAGGTYTLPRLVGAARAMGLTMLGEAITGEQAADWGLIWKAYAPDVLMGEARALVARLARQPVLGMALTKQALRASPGHTLAEQLALERDLQRRAGFSEDYREGVAAFFEKREPKFTGR